MDFRDPPEIVEFRRGLRTWLGAYLKEHTQVPRHGDIDEMRSWYRALAAAGYVAVSFPVEYGGRGLSAIHDVVINQELAAAGAPPPPPVAHIGHALSDFGSHQLKSRFLPGLLSCTESWCQGFSEPGAGSDLAGLSTTGTVDGDVIRVNGQKIWTSGAMWSSWCLLLLRTEPELARHKGLSMLVVDMCSNGIERRPVTLSNGSAEFAEVFFDDVVVPAANLVGSRGHGWAIAMHLLSFERGPADMGFSARIARDLARVQRDIRANAVACDAAARRRFARLETQVRVLEWHVCRTVANRDLPGAVDASIDKLFTTRVEQDVYRAVADLYGCDALVNDSQEFEQYIYSRAQSIYGGTQQIQRNIVAQRLLGLPRP